MNLKCYKSVILVPTGFLEQRMGYPDGNKCCSKRQFAPLAATFGSAKVVKRPTLYGGCWQRFDALPVQLQVNRVFVNVVDLRDRDGYFPLLKDMPRKQHKVGDLHGV